MAGVFREAAAAAAPGPSRLRLDIHRVTLSYVDEDDERLIVESWDHEQAWRRRIGRG
jgi:hypothetical protein